MSKSLYYLIVLLTFSVTAIAQNGLQFDGTDDKATVPYSTDFDFSTNDFTLEVNLASLQVGVNQTILSKRNASTNGFGFYISPTSQQLTISLDDNTLSITDPAIQIGQCLFVAAKRTNDSIFLYVNNTPHFVGINTKNLNLNTDLLFGYDGAATIGNNPFQGTIEDIRIWNIARTTAAISTNSNNCLNGTEANLVGYWNLEEATSVYAHDISNSNHAYLGNSVYPDAADPSWQTTTCIATSCCNTTADFSLPTTPNANHLSLLSDASTNADSVWWIVNGDTTRFSTTGSSDLSFTFSLGTNTVQLIAFGQNCIDIKTTLVDVIPQLAPCGVDAQNEWRKLNDPDYYKNLQNLTEVIRQAELGGGNQARQVNGKYFIPIVFHVIDLDTAVLASFPLARIQKQLDTLNHYFETNNVDIVFCLAKKLRTGSTDWSGLNQWNGQNIQGVTYTVDTSIYKAESRRYLAGLSFQYPFPASSYLNVFVVDSVMLADSSQGVLGVSSLGPTRIGDYTAVRQDAFVDGSTFSLGKVLIHEIGHWLGLSHVFGGINQDKICDTYNQGPPTAGTSVSNCNTPYSIPLPSGCTPAAVPYFQGTNILDYSFESCLRIFTQGQANVMETMLDYRKGRPFLVSRINLINTGLWQIGGCVDSTSLAADFTVSLDGICPGFPVEVSGTNTPLPASLFRAVWNPALNGGQAAPSSGFNVTLPLITNDTHTTDIVFDSAGVWTIIHEVSYYDSTAMIFRNLVDSANITILDCSVSSTRNRLYSNFDSLDWFVNNISIDNVPDIATDTLSGYILTGSSLYATKEVGIVMTTDLDGKMQWRKEIELVDENIRFFDILKEVTYNGQSNCYALTGYISRNNKTQTAPYLVILDRSGNILLQKSYPMQDSLGNYFDQGVATKCIQRQNGDIVLVGSTGDGFNNTDSKHGFVLNLENSPTLNIRWSHYYNFTPDFSLADYDGVVAVVEVFEDFGNGLESALIVSGNFTKNAPPNPVGCFFACLRIDPVSNLVTQQWRNNYTTPGFNIGSSIASDLVYNGRLFSSHTDDIVHSVTVFEIAPTTGNVLYRTGGGDMANYDMILDGNHLILTGGEVDASLLACKIPLPDTTLTYWEVGNAIFRRYDGANIAKIVTTPPSPFNPLSGNLARPENIAISPNGGYMIMTGVKLTGSSPTSNPNILSLKVDDILVSSCGEQSDYQVGALPFNPATPIINDSISLSADESIANAAITPLPSTCPQFGCSGASSGDALTYIKCASDSLHLNQFTQLLESNLSYDWSPGIYLDDSTAIYPTTTTPISLTYRLVVTDTVTNCEVFRGSYQITSLKADTMDICIPCLSDVAGVYQYTPNVSRPHTIDLFQVLTLNGLPTTGTWETANSSNQSFLNLFYNSITGLLNFPNIFNNLKELVYKYPTSCGENIAYVSLGFKANIATNSPLTNGVLTVCDGDSVTFTAVDTISPYTTRIWEVVNGTDTLSYTQIDSFRIGVTFPFINNANYIVQYTVQSNSCTGDANLYFPSGIAFNQIPVTVTSPTVDISLIQCFSPSTLFFSSFASPQDTIQWYEVNTGILIGETNNSLVVNSAGNYYATITSRLGCEVLTDTFSFNPANTNPLTATISSSNSPSCSGVLNGAITVSANGGTLPYAYLWSDGQTNATASGLGSGNYTVTVTDACGGSVILADTLSFSPSLVLSLSGSNLLCAGDNNGSITATLSGGLPPYQYNWNNGQTNATAINLAGGTYTLVATDANGCTISVNNTITEPTALVSSIGNQTNIACANTTTGSVLVTTTGGTGSYTYDIGNGNQANSNFTLLTAGNYTITTTDANGCTHLLPITITSPMPLQTTAVVTDVSCTGLSDGGIVPTHSGGTQPYSYQWSSGQTISKITNLAASTYTLTLTDANGCTEITTYTIGNPTPIQLSLVATGIDCSSGNNSGQIVANATGGTLPYTYTWSTRGTIDTLSNLAVGTYCLTLTDANGCTSTACDSIAPAPNPLTVSKTASVRNATPNSTFNYTIDITNNCQSTINVQVLDTLPVGLLLLNSGGLTYDPATRILATTTLLGGGVTQTFDISVQVIGMARCRRNFRYWNTATAVVVNRPATLVLDSVRVRVRDTAAINCAPVIANAVNFSAAIQAGTLLPFATATTTSQTVVIAGTWIVDNPYNFVNSTIYMQPGAEIIVPNGSSLNLDNTTVRGGCNNCMWHRILIEDGGSILTSNGTNIFDAQYGIQANSGSLLKQITNTTFSGNFIGIYIPPNPKGNVVGIGAFRENTFTSRNIPSNFVGMLGTPMLDSRQNTILVSPTAATPTFLKPGLAGIVAWNTGAINLNDATATNDFRRLVAGIVLFRSNLKTNSCHFNQITECYACYPPTLEFHGCGIYLQTEKGTHSIEFEGTLNNPNQNLTSFRRCDIGVSSRGGNTRVTGADFNRMARFGIRGISCFNSTISIKSNSMNRLEGVGIGLFDNGVGTDVLIDGNSIVVNNTTTANQFRACIQLTSNPAFNYTLQITSNEILPRDGQFGITLTGFRPDKLVGIIADNDITLNGTTANRAGIGVFDSEINLSCNRIEGNRRNLRNARNFGIVGSIARGGTWQCNTLDNMTTGVFFSGLNDIDFKGNRFDTHETGLLLNSSAVIGRQTDQGNRWTGNTTNDAMNFNAGNIFNSEFFVDPQFGLVPNNFNGSLAPNWFTLQPSGNTFDCNAPLQICNAPLSARTTSNNSINNLISLNVLDTAIVNGDTLSSSYNAATTYSGQRNLYDKLNQSSTTIPSGLFQNFVTTCQNNCIGHFDAIEEQVSNAFEMNTTDSVLLDSLSQLCHYYSDTLVGLDSILGINFTNSIASQRKLLATNLANALEQYELLVQQIQIQQQADITPICNVNNGFVTAAIHEELGKQVNTIYMNTFAQGIVDFNTTQLNTLRLIASYCPQEGGTAVHQAQALLSIVEDVDFLNFDCVNEQTKTIEEESSFEIDWTVHLFPNPTHNELTIKSSQLLEGNTTIEIFNALGQLVVPVTKYKELQITIIDVSVLLDGVYTMRLKNGEESITKPFIVIK